MRREWMIVAIVAVALAGCAPAVRVPPDAKLVAYGLNLKPKPMSGAGTYYFYDDSAGKLVGAMYSPDGTVPAFSLRADRCHRIYFAADK